MISKKIGKNHIRKFDSITDMYSYYTKQPVQEHYKGKQQSIINPQSFTGTKSFEEAEDLLLHGWEYMAQTLKQKLDVKNTEKTYKQKTVYDVQGFQACVPRYLHGVPENMIRTKKFETKTKVITINKSISYHNGIKTSTIIDESVKVLHLVQSLERQGYKVNLNIMFCVLDRQNTRYARQNFIFVNIKQASQRLNVKQTAFPLVNPSMLRRIILRIMEVSEEYYNTDNFVYLYGFPLNDCSLFDKAVKEELEGQYYIPNIINEKEITNIEKYLIK